MCHNTNKRLFIEPRRYKLLAQVWAIGNRKVGKLYAQALHVLPHCIVLQLQGEVVYVEYGQNMDYVVLSEKYNVSFSGKIVLARLGGCSIRNKVTNDRYSHFLNRSYSPHIQSHCIHYLQYITHETCEV